MNGFENVPSLIKWTGSKRLQAKEIQKFIPDNINTYYEPFLGGASILYNNTDKITFANDVYQVIIDLWRLVQTEPNYVIETYSKNWELLQADFPNYFYYVRDRFNLNQQPTDLLFLSRTAVNGIIRFNSRGDFNNSIHLSRRGMKPTTFAKIVMKWHHKIQNTKFTSEDYSSFLKRTKKGDFVYLDPPYAGSTSRYVQNLDLEKLINELSNLNAKGVKWALSFDGLNSNNNYQHHIPEKLYRQVIEINIGKSKVSQVLNKVNDDSHEHLYLNY